MGMATKSGKKPKREIFIIPLILLVVVLFFWHIQGTFEERTWKEYRQAGHRAFDRGNFKYAEKMYRRALKEARDLGPESPLIEQSLADLDKVYKAQGKGDQAGSSPRSGRKK